MELIGYVGQDIFLIDDTIISNIAFGIDTDKVNKKALENAINSSKLDELVKELPEGIYSRVGERGVQLSGGQRQRIGIARALYRDPQLLIFDEATASLDNYTEELVIKSIINLKREKMIIMVAHRLSTLVNCDKVFEIKDGGIIEVDIKTLSKNENQ
jgi:ATP-binding cassette subfamily C protein